MNHELEAHEERQMLDEIAFWGVHTFREEWFTCACTLCGGAYWDVIHVGEPEWNDL